MSKEAYIQGIRTGDVRSLSKVISLAESGLEADRLRAIEILEACPPTGTGRRIGITGSPGSGKSTLIDRFGLQLLESGAAQRIAVLSIDPSSSLSGGSILGDKTRMEALSRSDRAYIRPSASGHSLGGLARSTRLSMLLCEAAGFDTILIESVGVGQSETEIAQLTDLFVLILNPGGGDELQGIKRGIVEMADLLVVNKADGDGKALAERTAKDYRLAQHLMPPTDSGWEPPVLACSALEGSGLDVLEEKVDAFYDGLGPQGLHRKRLAQERYWLRKLLETQLLERVAERSSVLLSEAAPDQLPERLAIELSKKIFD